MMFAVRVGENLYGPFKNANAAAKWARSVFMSPTAWTIVPLRKPS